MQKIEIIGNLGGDAEIKIFNDRRYVSFSVACSERRADANGVVSERTTWYSVLKRGEGNIIQYLKRGTKVFVRGGLNAKIYNDKRGVPCVALNVNADEIQLCGLKPSERSQQGQAAQQQQCNDDVDWNAGGDSDLPF